MGDQHEFLRDIREKTVELPLDSAKMNIIARYLRQRKTVDKLVEAVADLDNKYPGADKPLDALTEEDAKRAEAADQEAARQALDPAYARNRKEIEAMREEARQLRAKAKKAKTPFGRAWNNARAHALEAKAENADQLLERMMDPQSESRQHAEEQRKVVARLYEEADKLKQKAEAESDEKQKRRLIRQAIRATIRAKSVEADLNKLEGVDYSIGVAQQSHKLQMQVATQRRERKQAVITRANLLRDLQDEQKKLSGLMKYVRGVFTLERNGVNTLSVRMLSKRDFDHVADVVQKTASGLPVSGNVSDDPYIQQHQLEVVVKQFDFAREHARDLLGEILPMLDEIIQKMDGNVAGRKLMAEVIPPIKKEQIASYVARIRGGQKTVAAVKSRRPAP